MNESGTTVFDTATVNSWLDGMLEPLMQLFDDQTPIALIGIRRGGVDVGTRLLSELKSQGVAVEDELGELNIAFYRDDFSSMGLHPVVGPSQVPFEIEDKHIVLVDDVLGTGRTVRAAMNEIFDYGRPAKITLAVLVERSGHELPIRADVVGHALEVSSDEYIDLDAAKMQVSVGKKS